MAHPGQTLDNAASGERITFRLTAAETKGELVAVDVELPQGARVPGGLHSEPGRGAARAAIGQGFVAADLSHRQLRPPLPRSRPCSRRQPPRPYALRARAPDEPRRAHRSRSSLRRPPRPPHRQATRVAPRCAHPATRRPSRRALRCPEPAQLPPERAARRRRVTREPVRQEHPRRSPRRHRPKH